MSKEPVHVSSSPEKGHNGLGPNGNRGTVMVARVVGILCVAAGFMLGIHGLDYPDSPMLPTALGMIATGLVAQVFALVKACFVSSQGKE